MKPVTVGDVEIDNCRPLTLIGGVNVIESRDMVLHAAEAFVEATRRLAMPLVFKASFDKANRSSLHSFRGPGLEEGLALLSEVKSTFGVPVITDVHESLQAAPVAEICDILQIPAFLARQTDLVRAIAQTGRPVHVKKPQFVSPGQVRHIVEKICAFGNDQILICERGTAFGYDNLVVDILGFEVMKQENGGRPLVFDVTHALQQREPGARASGGRREHIDVLARAGIAAGIAALFLEAHADPDQARCDGPSALPLSELPRFLAHVKTVDDVIKPLLQEQG